MSSSIDAKKIMAVVKSNIVIAICVLVIIGSLVGLPYVSNGLMEEVKTSVDKQSRSYSGLKKIKDGSISIPGASSVKAVVNRAIIDRIQDVANDRKNESVSVLDAAKSINRGAHVNLDDRLFPGHDLPSHELQIEAPRFQKRVVEEYKSLLEDVNAGMPPSDEAVMKGLDQVRQQFLDNHLRRDSVKGLSESEVKMVRAELSERRMGLYLREAEKSGVYLELSQLDPPVYNERQIYTPKDLFRWQWRFWVLEEIIDAISKVNGPEATVIQAPIKRILDLRVRDLMSMDDSGGGGSSGGQPPAGSSQPSRPTGPSSSPTVGMASSPGGGGGSAKRSAAGGSGGSNARSSAGGSRQSGSAAGNQLVVASVPAAGAEDFSVSLTGRISNALYDVVLVEASLVAETSKVSEILESLASNRFLTVRDLAISKMNAYGDLKDGFLYGDSPVVRLDLTLETIWLRSWIQDMMPNSVRALLGIQPVKTESTDESDEDDYS
ncbi:MAG: hypothetical protein P8J89_10265 [Phycisphaerales bacterium]|nr:hypothetical protein [Phycisphaerales bacterium]